MRSIAECAVGYLFLLADVTQLIVSEHAGVMVESTNNPEVTEDKITQDKIITQVKVPPMSREGSGPSLDVSVISTEKKLRFLARQRPSAQEAQGDGRLDAARSLATENEEFIDPNDLEIVRARIIL